jgi:hypothetical protein
MDLDWVEFKRGYAEREKAAFDLSGGMRAVGTGIGLLARPVETLTNKTLGALGSVRKLPGVIGDTISKNIGNAVNSGIGKAVAGIGALAVPALGTAALMGAFGGKNNQNGEASPQQGVLPPQKNILTERPGEVNSMNAPKLAGLIDPNMVRSVLTAKAVNSFSNTLATPANRTSPEGEAARIAIESKHPEMKKLLADPAAREYLESLLKETPTNAN